MTNQNIQNNVGPQRRTRQSMYDANGKYLVRKEWLTQNYAKISEPGVVKLQVVSEPFLYDPFTKGEDGNPRFIINLKAICTEDVPELSAIINQDGAELVRAEDIQHLLLTATVFTDMDEETGQFVPNKPVPHRGQWVECNIEYVTLRDGSTKLRVRDVYPAPPMKVDFLSKEELFGQLPQAQQFNPAANGVPTPQQMQQQFATQNPVYAPQQPAAQQFAGQYNPVNQ